MFERFTDAARRVIVHAQEECRTLSDDRVRSEHVLLGILTEGVDVPGGRGLEQDGIRAEVARRQPQRHRRPSGHVPFTVNAKKVLERSLQEADRLGRWRITPAALLLGTVRTEDSGAVAVLRTLNVDLPAVAQAAERAVSSEDAGDGPRRSRSEGARLQPRRGYRRLSYDRSSAERNRLADALRRYGRHDPGCAGATACTCGLQSLLDDVGTSGR